MKYIKKISDYSMVGGMGAIMVGSLVGCGDGATPPQPVQPQPSGIEEAAKKGSFLIIEETAPKEYKIAEEFPAKETRVVLKSLDGTEKVLTQEELDQLIKEEEKKIDAGTSALTQPAPQNAEASDANSGGMGLGATLLASVAGGMLGAYLGNKLFGNQNYQNNRRASYKSPSTYARSQSSFNKARSSSSSRSTSTKKSGFFKKTTPSKTSAPARKSTNNFSSSRSSSRGG
jgi:hypothetical protein